MCTSSPSECGCVGGPSDAGVLCGVGPSLCPELPGEAPATRDPELGYTGCKIIILFLFIFLK